MALESFPPLALLTLRFTLSGGILLVVAYLSKSRIPKGRELWISAVTGVLGLGVGTGSLVFAELWIPSGLAALIVSFSPFWMVGVDALTGGEPFHRPTVAGLLVGLAGAILLVSSGASHSSVGGAMVAGFVLLQIGSVAWAFASVYQRRQPGRTHPIVVGAIQQLAAGIAFAPAALLIPEHPIVPSVRGVGALFYLVIFGSIVGYSSYIYALTRLRLSLASVYSYVNPLVAVILGWIVYREPFGWRESVAMAVIFVGVALVKRYGK